MEAFWFPWHQITLKDFEDDFSFSWHLSANIKEQLIRIFVARLNLFVTIGHLNKVLWKRTASEMLAVGETPDFTAHQPSDCLPIEEIEVRFQRWKLDNTSLLSMVAPNSTSWSEQRLLRADQIFTRLHYE
jgi:hypothetical protein